MIAYVRRKSAAFSRGRSKYRGVSGQAGRWEARIGAYCGRKNVSIDFMTSNISGSNCVSRSCCCPPLAQGQAGKHTIRSTQG